MSHHAKAYAETRSSNRHCHLLPSRVAAAIAFATIVACSGGGDTTEPPAAVVVTISPTTASVNAGATQSFSATVTNAATNAVTWTASGGSIVPSGATAVWTAPLSGGPFTITAKSTSDPTKSASATVTVNAVGISITPATASVGAGGTQQFTAAVTNTTNIAVTWTASGGTISGTDATVMWTAPVASGSYTVTATSVADASRTAVATVTVTPVQIVVTPGASELWRGEPITMTAAVTGTENTGLTWTASCGTISGNGLSVTYTAPESVTPCTVTARSTVDNTKFATATTMVRSAWRVASLTDTDDGACTYMHCSLREAITVANAQPNVDTIRIVNSTAGTITLNSALPAVSNPLHIIGPGVNLLTVNANGSVASPRRGFLFGGNWTGSLRGLTVRGGVYAEGAGVALDNGVNMTLADVRVVDNEAINGHGGGMSVVTNSHAQLVRVVIDSNRTSGTNQPGGGMTITNGAVVTMSGGSVSDNTVNNGWGGGIRVLSASLVLDTVTVRRNRVLDGSGQGGGILAEGVTTSLTLHGSTIQQNTGLTDGGGIIALNTAALAIVNSVVDANSATAGGGIVAGNVANMTMTGSTVRNNISSTRAGGLFLWGTSVANIGSSIIRLNKALETGGGGLYLQNTVIAKLTATVVDSNRAEGPISDAQGGGGVWAGAGTRLEITGGSIGYNFTQFGWGGAIFAFTNTVILTDVTARNNNTGGAGGAYAFQAQSMVTMTGGAVRDNISVVGSGGGMILRGSTANITNTEFTGNVCELRGGAIQMYEASNATLNNVTVTNNECKGDGGGIGSYGESVLTMTNGLVDNNRSINATGGGIGRSSTGALTITGTRISNNRSQTQGGGLQVGGTATSTFRNVTISGNTAVAGGGGGMTIGGAASLIENSTISGNTSAGTGGGIFSASTANTTVRNSTLSGNAGTIGGGIGATGVALLQSVTIVGNTATGFGGGIGSNGTGNVTAVNVLLSGNTQAAVAQNCGTESGGVITSTGGNLSNDATCAAFTKPTDKANTASGVNPTLANNGGPTFTHALQEGSAAINAGVPASCPVADQRGFTRQGACDIGAFEFGGTAASMSSARARAAQTAPSPAQRRKK